jgi:hypothetical protein
MTGHDDEFEDFLRRKRPIFSRSGEEPLEPPAELDRLILRQARDAIQEPKPQRVFRAPGWGMPVALAATLVLAFTVILHTANSPERVAGQVAVQNVARSVETAPVGAAVPPAAELAQAAAAPSANYSRAAEAAAPSDGVIVADLIETEADARAQGVAGDVARARAAAQSAGDRALVAREEAERYAEPPPGPIPTPTEQAAPASATVMSKSASGAYAPAQADAAEAVARKAPGLSPDYRRDSKTWLAEIERLRTAGDTARADAELAEFKRQHRAYATSPDR